MSHRRDLDRDTLMRRVTRTGGRHPTMTITRTVYMFAACGSMRGDLYRQNRKEARMALIGDLRLWISNKPAIGYFHLEFRDVPPALAPDAKVQWRCDFTLTISYVLRTSSEGAKP